jgi:hypothetical protein
MKLEIEISENLGTVVNEIGSDVLTTEVQRLIDCVKQSMDELKVNSSYGLSQSIESTVVSEGEADILMDGYWKFVEYGVKGVHGGSSNEGYSYKSKRPPMEAMQSWLKFKGITSPLPVKKSQASDFMRMMGFKFANIIYYKGIRARHFVERGIEKYLKTK